MAEQEKTNFWQHLDFVKQCRQYDLTLWQCPSFLFPIIGLINIATILTAYFIGRLYVEPEVIALLVLIITIILLIIGYLIVRSFDHLAQANRMKSEFVNIVSHELRSPLTNINWLIDLIIRQQRKGNGKLKTELEDIKESNRRMIRLVNNLLNVSRIERNKVQFRLKAVSLTDMAKELIHEYAPLAKASNIGLKLKSAGKLSKIRADREGIRLVFRNLIDNAVKYSRTGSQVNISITQEGSRLRCEVEDKGVGLSQPDQKRLFQKFFRGRGARKQQPNGTGLGLYISREFIRLHKGKMGFRSQEGQGSTFWFEVPVI